MGRTTTYAGALIGALAVTALTTAPTGQAQAEVPSDSAVASGCTGTLKVTDASTGDVLGRISLQSGVANPVKRKSDWTTFKLDRAIRAGGVGQLRIIGTGGRVLEGFVGGYSSDPKDLMETGTADNVYFQSGEPDAEAPFETRATSIWKWKPRSGDLRVVWTQPDESRFPLTGWYDPGSNYTGSAADFDQFDQRLDGRAAPVTYSFVKARNATC